MRTINTIKQLEITNWVNENKNLDTQKNRVSWMVDWILKLDFNNSEIELAKRLTQEKTLLILKNQFDNFVNWTYEKAV